MVQIKLRLNPLVPHNLVYVAATFAKLEIPVPEKRLRKIAIHILFNLSQNEKNLDIRDIYTFDLRLLWKYL